MLFFLKIILEDSNIIPFNNPQRANIKITSRRSLISDGGYSSGKDVGSGLHPDFPFKPNFLATVDESDLDFEGLPSHHIMPNSPQIAEHISNKFHAALDNIVANIPKTITPILSPLNSLQSPHKIT